jgi:hypothetical protein
MATVNLGSIKFKWKGTYAGGTAYTIDDVVSYNGSSYICILASTGNLPTNATYFEQMSSAGTNGTDGTDLTTTLTTQGDLVYRDGSGLQRLGAGTAGQVLQTGGTGANPSWTTVSADVVELYSVGNVSTASEINLNGYFNDDYDFYRIIGSFYGSSGGGGFYIRARSGVNGATEETSNYNFSYSHHSRDVVTTGNTQTADNSEVNNSHMRIGWDGRSGSSQYPVLVDVTVDTPTRSGETKSFLLRSASWDNNYFGHAHGAGFWNSTTAMTGIKFYSTNNISARWIKILGYK